MKNFRSATSKLLNARGRKRANNALGQSAAVELQWAHEKWLLNQGASILYLYKTVLVLVYYLSAVVWYRKRVDYRMHRAL